jgi:DNA-binding transcriptional ArsR family regulator
MFHYLVKEDEFLPAKEIDEKGLKALEDEQRRKILNMVSERDMTVSELVSELDMGRQTLYYNLEKLQEGGLIASEGSRPKYFSSDIAAYYFRPENVEPEQNPLMLENVPDILEGFVEDRKIDARVIVGAPYPHGEHDRRHKNAYKAGEITAILGNYGRKRQQLIYMDTEVDEKIRERPLISVAGPLVNTLTDELNSEMPAKFTEGHDRIITENSTYSGDETGFIAKAEVEGKERIVVAGLFGLGTSAAIEALSSRAQELGENGAVVKGYGTKHSIEEVEIVEKL